MKVVLSSIVAVVSASDTAAPIAKILETIASCEGKVIKEGEEAQRVYEEYAEWCEDRAKNLGYEVKTAKSQSDGLEATIGKETSTQLALSSKIDDLGSDIATDEKELAAATKIRNQEATDFQTDEKDLMGVSDSLARAIAVIEREMNSGGASMMQLKSASSITQVFKVMVEASAMNTADASRLTAFVQSSNTADDDDEAGAPAAAVYDSHSGGIVDVLGGLREKADEQLDEIRKAETASKFAYDQSKQSLDDAIRYANEDFAEAKKNLAASQESQAVATGDLGVTKKDLAEDQSTLAGVHQACMARSQDFETQTKSRSEELRGLAAAKSAVGQIQLRGNQFLQISATEHSPQEAVNLLRNLARKQKDQVLAQIASRMASTVKLSSKEDVFDQIRADIEDSIAKLQDEQAADATQTAFCDKEMKEAKEKVAVKEAKVEKHTTKIDMKSSGSKRVKQEVAILQNEVAQMTKEKLEMDTLRQKENADYNFNLGETSQSLTEIKFALKVLRDFYDNYAKEHTGFSSSDGTADGLIAMLEVTESDYSKAIYEMKAVEDAAAAEYKVAAKVFETDKVVKDKAVEYKTREYVSLDKYAVEETADREGTQAQLDANNEALSTLEGMCIGKAETYKERVARRDAEIADLKESMQSIEDQAAAEASEAPAAEAPAAEAAVAEPAVAEPAVAEVAAAEPVAAEAAVAEPAAEVAAAEPAAAEPAAEAAAAEPAAAEPVAAEPAAAETPAFVQRSVKRFRSGVRTLSA